MLLSVDLCTCNLMEFRNSHLESTERIPSNELVTCVKCIKIYKEYCLNICVLKAIQPIFYLIFCPPFTYYIMNYPPVS